MYKVTTEAEDGRLITHVLEDYEGEAEYLFLEADKEVNEEVDVLYALDNSTGEEIELWRRDLL